MMKDEAVDILQVILAEYGVEVLLLVVVFLAMLLSVFWLVRYLLKGYEEKTEKLEKNVEELQEAVKNCDSEKLDLIGKCMQLERRFQESLDREARLSKLLEEFRNWINWGREKK